MALDYPLLDPAAVVDRLAPHTMTVRFLVGAMVLLYAIWTDLLERRVRNHVWYVPLGFGAVLAIVDVLGGAPPVMFLILVPVVMAVAYVLWRLRVLFGGADAKCVMSYALLVPYTPAIVVGMGPAYPHLPVFMPLAITMLSNAVVLTLVLPIGYFLVNLSRGHVHPVAMWLGTRVPLRRVLDEPLWVMDWVKPAPGHADPGEEGPALADTAEDPELDHDGLPHVETKTLEGATTRLAYMPTRAGDYALNIARLKALGIDNVWAQPKVPFMIPLFLGFLSAFLVGDLIMSALLWAMGAL